MAAFNRSGIRRELFYRITRKGAKNAVGHKIQLLTKEQFNKYKKSMIDREEILKNAPSKDAGCVSVPKVVE